MYKIWLHALYHEINLLFLPFDPAAKEGWPPTTWVTYFASGQVGGKSNHPKFPT